jgi:hypothetical protein
LPSRNPTRDDAHPIATSIATVGRMKRLLKIADEMQPELERDQPFARMVARVGKLDADAVPLGFALIDAASRSDRHPDTDPVDPIVRRPIKQAHPS